MSSDLSLRVVDQLRLKLVCTSSDDVLRAPAAVERAGDSDTVEDLDELELLDERVELSELLSLSDELEESELDDRDRDD